MKRSSSVLWGIVLVIVGGIFTLNSLELTNIDLFFEGWWTLLIIIPSFVGLFTWRDKTACLIGLFIGSFLLACSQGLLDYDMLWKLTLPVLTVIIGVKLIVSGLISGKPSRRTKRIHQQGTDIKNASVFFSDTKLDLTGEYFQGADINAVFGDVSCNLRDAVVVQDCVINCFSIFGETEIIVPENVNVQVYSTSLFGGVSDKRRNKTNNNPFTVYVNSTCIFGGVDIRG